MDTKSYVIEEAATLFYENGIKSVRMDDIAVHCSMSKRTIYELFESREKLLEACIEMMMGKLNGMYKEMTAEAQNVLEEVWIIADASFDKVKVGRLLRELIKYYPALAKRVGEKHYHDSLKQNHDKLMLGVEEGLLLPHLDMDYFAVTFTRYIFGLPEVETVMPTKTSTAIMIYMRGMCTNKGREYIDKQILKIE